jgi:uncharacterized Rossmann fold enzyme
MYLQINEKDDYRACEKLNLFIQDDLEEELFSLIRDREVAIVGAGPSLRKVKDLKEEIIVAADGASRYLESYVRTPDIIVTDLDGITKINGSSFYVVHAHGDNIPSIDMVIEMKKMVGTCQGFQLGRTKMYGGFTDGDRAALLALIAKARKVSLYGMDFDNEKIGMYSKPYLLDDIPLSERKKIKLKIAKEILEFSGLI